MKQKSFLVFGIFALLTSAYLLVSPSKAEAATITVTNADDNTTTNTQCTFREAITNINDQANSFADCAAVGTYGSSDTINFNISGGGSTYTEQSQTGYTISSNSGYTISQSVTINGFSQPGSDDNDTTAPQPIDAILLIEFDGTAAGAVNGFEIEANNVTIRGLVINNFTNDAIDIDGNSHTIAGCFIGVDPDGETAAPNSLGIANGATGGDGLVIGGLNAADRNIISGNTDGGSSPNTGHNNWTYYGNFIGVARDGLTAVPNAQPGGSGAISLDNSNGHVVGGTVSGAINVISGNNSFGLAPQNTDDLTIQGNYIGVGYDGTTSVPNQGAGITSSLSDNTVIGGTATGAANIISNNGIDGILFNQDTNVSAVGNRIENNDDDGIQISDSTNVTIGGTSTNSSNTITGSGGRGIEISGAGTYTNIAITGNTIDSSSDSGVYAGFPAENIIVRDNDITNNGDSGVALNGVSDIEVYGNTITGNSSRGVHINDSSTVTVGSGNSADRNVISDNAGPANVEIYGFNTTASDNVVQGNYIGTDQNGNINSGYNQNAGVLIEALASNSLIGGSTTGQGNLIAGNSGAGIVVSRLFINAGPELVPASNAILGNSIHSNEGGNFYTFPLDGLGIDLLNTELDGGLNRIAVDSENVTTNDDSDPDSGPNNFINFPVINSATQDGTNLSVNFDLDANNPAENTLRVEFFANDSADASGHGEGQTYLGATTVEAGDSQTANITLPNTMDLTGKYLTATATATNAGIASGFGATSEFSLASDIDVIAPAVSGETEGSLANTGLNTFILTIIASVLVISGGTLTYRKVRI